MNYSTVVFLINKGVRCISVIYDPNEGAKTTLFKTLDPTIEKDDLVIVPTNTRHGFTIAKVVGVDLDVDFDSPTTMQWIVGRVDRGPYEQTLKQETDAVDKIKNAEIRKKRDALRDALIANSQELRSLEIADMREGPAQKKW